MYSALGILYNVYYDAFMKDFDTCVCWGFITVKDKTIRTKTEIRYPAGANLIAILKHIRASWWVENYLYAHFNHDNFEDITRKTFAAMSKLIDDSAFSVVRVEVEESAIYKNRCYGLNPDQWREFTTSKAYAEIVEYLRVERESNAN